MLISELIALIFGEADNVVPMFIHNPKSQKIEAVVVTTLDGALTAFGRSAPAAAPQPAAPAQQ